VKIPWNVGASAADWKIKLYSIKLDHVTIASRNKGPTTALCAQTGLPSASAVAPDRIGLPRRSAAIQKHAAGLIESQRDALDPGFVLINVFKNNDLPKRLCKARSGDG